MYIVTMLSDFSGMPASTRRSHKISYALDTKRDLTGSPYAYGNAVNAVAATEKEAEEVAGRMLMSTAYTNYQNKASYGTSRVFITKVECEVKTKAPEVTKVPLVKDTDFDKED